MLNFTQQLQNVSDFFKPENLAKQTIKYEGEVALLVIDVQKQFCDPQNERGNAETEAVSKRIKSLVPEFKKAGIPVYAVYYSRNIFKPDAKAQLDFYEFSPAEDDVIVLKDRDSAFEGGGMIKQILKKDKRKLLLTCGFNLSACVKRTVMDALGEGFDVCLLRDLTGNDNSNGHASENQHLAEMQKKGVVMEQSNTVLEQLRAHVNAPAMTA